MKHLKQKLMAATAMLMVSAVMMTTSTYAWFAISTAPEVTDITTTIQATGAFEIALGTTDDAEPGDTALGDTGDDTTWGATVTEIDGFTGLEFPMTADDAGTGYETATYGDDGRPEEALATVTFDDYSYASGIASVTADITVGDDVENKVVASSTLLWLRTNTAVADATFELGTITVYESDGTTTATDIDSDNIGVTVIVDDVVYAEGDSISFDANEATSVEVMVYLEGADVTNEILGEAYEIVLESITFSSDTIDAL